MCFYLVNNRDSCYPTSRTFLYFNFQTLQARKLTCISHLEIFLLYSGGLKKGVVGKLSQGGRKDIESKVGVRMSSYPTSNILCWRYYSNHSYSSFYKPINAISIEIFFQQSFQFLDFGYE